jgi:hypothetical protein
MDRHMQIARIEDTFPLNGQTILSGIVVLDDSFSLASIRSLLKKSVNLVLPDGREFLTEILTVDVQEGFSGQIQIMIGIRPLLGLDVIPHNSILKSGLR